MVFRHASPLDGEYFRVRIFSIPSVEDLSVWSVDTWTRLARLSQRCALRSAGPLERVPVVERGVSERIFVEW